MSSSSWKDDLVPLVGPFDADQLFGLQPMVMIGWLLLWIAPNWKYTDTVAWILITFFALLYLMSIVTLIVQSDSSFSSADFGALEGIVQVFQNPNFVYVGWIHYLSFDLFVGRFISADARVRTSSYLQYLALMGPCLYFTLMFGPVGLVLYGIVRTLFLPAEQRRVEV